jgi:hypothetical protein
LTAAISATAVDLTVESLYLGSSDIVGRQIWIRLVDGSYICREIVAVADANTIIVDSVFGVDVPIKDISKILICYLYKVRFNIDELLLEYTADLIAEANLTFQVVW